MATSIKVRFTLTGVNIDHDQISHAIGLAPTKTWRRGEQRASSALRWEHDGWMLSTNEEAALDLEGEVNKLMKHLKGRTKQINRICKQFKLEAEIGCSVYIEDRQAPSIHLSSKILKSVNELGADIDIDVYC